MSNKFPSFMDTIYSFFYTAWKESAAKALKDDDIETFYNSIYDILRKILYSITIGMIACLPFVFNILIKEEFMEAYKYIPILLIAMYFSNMSGFYGGIFSAYKHTKVIGSTTIISAIINLLVNIVLIRYIGIWAAAFSTLMATAIVYLLRKRKISDFVILKGKINIISIIIAVICILCYYNINIYINIINIVLVVGYCIYLNKNILKMFIKEFTKKIKEVYK